MQTPGEADKIGPLRWEVTATQSSTHNLGRFEGHSGEEEEEEDGSSNEDISQSSDGAGDNGGEML